MKIKKKIKLSNLAIILNKDYGAIIILIISFLIFRITYLIRYKKRFNLKEELILMFFLIYLFVLAKIVTYSINEYGMNNYIPFKEITRYKINSNLFIQNIVGNIILFVPIGMFLKYYLKLNFLYMLIVVIIYSFSIESTQLLIGRVFDIDDIILNVLGAFIGFCYSVLIL